LRRSQYRRFDDRVDLSECPKGRIIVPHIYLESETSTDAEFISAASAAAANVRSGAPSGYVDPLGSTIIDLGPGDYTVTQINAVLGQETLSGNTFGLVIRGSGSALTTVIFSPATAGSLITNNHWYGVRFEGIRFVATTAGCTFMASDTDSGSAQDYIFTDCSWQGWHYVFDLTGADNNSEYRFFGCQTFEIETGGAFLYVGATDTSDQFLNYWFYGFKHWSTSAPLIDSAAGGHYHLYGVDASAWGAAGGVSLINLRGGQHAWGVCTCTVDGLRVEIFNATSALLYCEWEQGNVSLRGVDVSPLTFEYTYGAMFTFVWLAGAYGPGPIYSIRDSLLAGTVAFTGTPQPGSKVVFDNCQWIQQDTPSAVIADPHGMVTFNGCSTLVNLPPASWAGAGYDVAFCTLMSPHTLVSQTAAQPLFNSSPNGAITLAAGTYFFECFFTLSGMSGTSGSFGFSFGGTATIAGQLWETEGNKGALGTAAAAQNTVNVGSSLAIVSPTASAYGWARISGKLRISGAGTLIPSVCLGVAAAAVVGTDSYFKINLAGGSTAPTAGSWS
jgi:hypothetical protein